MLAQEENALAQLGKLTCKGSPDEEKAFMLWGAVAFASRMELWGGSKVTDFLKKGRRENQV